MLQTIYNTLAGRKYRGYVELKDNITYIKTLVEHYTNKYSFNDFFKDSTAETSHNEHELIAMECISLSIIILYGKCFTAANRRRVKLEASMLKTANNEIRKTHKELMEARDNFVAHAGYTQLESFEFMLCYDNELTLQRSRDNYKILGGQLFEQKSMLPLLEHILIKIEKILEKIKKDLENEFQILEGKLSIILEKLNNKEAINDEDLK